MACGTVAAVRITRVYADRLRLPLAIARHMRVTETVNFHGGRLWPLEAALWNVAGQAADALRTARRWWPG